MSRKTKVDLRVETVAIVGALAILWTVSCLAEGRLYCLAEDGTTVLIAAGREFKELAKNPLDGPCKASPAISNGRVFIRSQDTLFCIRKRDESPSLGKPAG